MRDETEGVAVVSVTGPLSDKRDRLPALTLYKQSVFFLDRLFFLPAQ